MLIARSLESAGVIRHQRFPLTGCMTAHSTQCQPEAMLVRAGCCTQWLIYDAYAADQEAQRRAESDSNKRSAAARQGAAATHSAGDAKEASGAEPSAETVRAYQPICHGHLAPPLRSQCCAAPSQFGRVQLCQSVVNLAIHEASIKEVYSADDQLGPTGMLWRQNAAYLFLHPAAVPFFCTLQDEEDELGAAVERTARVMERMAYQNSEVELLMDYKVNAVIITSHDYRFTDYPWLPVHMPCDMVM